MIEVDLKARSGAPGELQGVARAHPARHGELDGAHAQRRVGLVNDDGEAAPGGHLQRNRIGIDGDDDPAAHGLPIIARLQLRPVGPDQFLQPQSPQFEQAVGARFRDPLREADHRVERRPDHLLADLGLAEHVLHHGTGDRDVAHRRQGDGRQRQAAEQLRPGASAEQRGRGRGAKDMPSESGHTRTSFYATGMKRG